MRKIFPLTLSLYLMRHYLMNFLMILLGLLAIIYIFDTVELLRQAAKEENVALSAVLAMGFFKLPEVGQMVFPFAILFSAMFSFWQLSRRHELVIVRAAGLSVWQFVTPHLVSAFLIGVVLVTILNPLGALMVKNFQSLKAEHLDRGRSIIQISNQGLWLRQSHEEGQAILHASEIDLPDWNLGNVIVFFFGQDHNFLRRLDASSANLQQGQWNFENVNSNKPGTLPERSEFLSLATDLTIEELEKSFADPETISFWRFPSYIQTMQNTGFDTTSLKIFFQGLLAKPLLFMAMILLAASVSLRMNRMGGGTMMIMLGIGIGFTIFFASSFLQALGASQQIPIAVSAWFPAIISFILGVSVLLALEDG